MLFRQYESFKMKSKKNTTNMYKGFSKLVNDLKGLKKSFETIKLVKKVHRLLPIHRP